MAWFGIKWPEKDWYAVKQTTNYNQPTQFSFEFYKTSRVRIKL